jgi:protein gp37
VFCASLADVFDNEVAQEWRDDLWTLIRETPNLRWLLLTKRIGNAPKMLPADWPYPNAGLGSSIVTQAEWDRDYHKLAALPAAFHFVSDEPTLERIDIGDARPDWIITGGESGRGFRPLDMDIVRHMRDQCARNGIAFHHKQNGGLRGKDSGCLVDGVEHKYFPPALAA